MNTIVDFRRSTIDDHTVLAVETCEVWFKMPCWHIRRCLTQRVLLFQAIRASHSLLRGSFIPAPVNKQTSSKQFICSAVLESKVLVLVKNQLTPAGWLGLWWVKFGLGRTWLWGGNKTKHFLAWKKKKSVILPEASCYLFVVGLFGFCCIFVDCAGESTTLTEHQTRRVESL